jgi:hypothetical protein
MNIDTPQANFIEVLILERCRRSKLGLQFDIENVEVQV